MALTPSDIAARYPGLATGDIRPFTLAEELGVTRHTIRVATQLARERRAYAQGREDALRADTDQPYDILVIPDAHVIPGEDLRRFAWVGQEVAWQAERSRDLGRRFALLSIGDFNDLESLSSWDKGKASGENARYHKDCAANKHALTLIHANIPEDLHDYVEKYIVLGNHEHRINRFANDNPSMQGHLSPGRDLGFDAFGWHTVPFLEPLCINGVYFIHFLPNAMGRAMAGVTLARRLVNKAHHSVVVGHTHWYGHYTEKDPLNGNRLHGVVVGCYFEADHEFAGPVGNNRYDRQLVALHNVVNGDFDLETVSMDSLRRVYDGT